MAQPLEVGRMLRAGTSAFVVGCRVDQLAAPAFGALVRARVDPDDSVFGLIHDIRIDDDGLVRQLVTAESVSEEVLLDNRERRIVPVELSVVVIGHEHAGRISHRLPARPPLSLDVIHLCDDSLIWRFASSGHFEYFRHILRLQDAPLGELFAAHFRQVRHSHADGAAWSRGAIGEIITLLRDDYTVLTSVLGALDDTTRPS
jgi:hypothetical protein